MKFFKSAFTMVELIFVIVILGILASVALPKLSATKNDSIAARLAVELGDCIEMAFGAYTKVAIFDVNSSSCDDVTVQNPCFIINVNNSNGIMKVQHVAGSSIRSICKKTQDLVEVNELSSSIGVEHHF